MPSSQDTVIWLSAAALAYVVGSIPFAVLLGRAKGIDIRRHGSRNVGATNVARVLGRRLGILCFVLDALKGAVPVFATGAVTGLVNRPVDAIGQVEAWLWLAVGAAAILGHMYSIFLKFSGGKGVATGFGAMFGMWPLLTVPALGALLVWMIVAALWRYVSLASMIAAAALPALTALWLLLLARTSSESAPGAIQQSWPLPATTALLALIVIWRHRANIGRLRRGEEPRIGA